ncbi:hypothetical protein C8Q75DRAFT_367824 [Abortiporus biennis]|nr:hypothetical protein C8Q75DRAFT_367824 [Abortiporus biennis]
MSKGIEPSRSSLCQHCRLHSSISVELSTKEKKRIASISSSKSQYATLRPICKLLNSISRRIHAQIFMAQYPHPIVFLDHHHCTPLYHSSPSPHHATHLLGVPGPKTDYERVNTEYRKDYINVPYTTVVTVVSWETTASKCNSLTKGMVRDLLHARPDLVGVYALSVIPTGYKAIWADASGFQFSSLSPWDTADLSPLFAYIYSLYVPPPGHVTSDPSVHSPVISPSKDISWTVESGEASYTNCVEEFSEDPIGRRTTVWIHSSDDDFVVIKDTFCHDDELLKETKILEEIHSLKGLVPGVVSVMHSSTVALGEGDADKLVKTASCSTSKGKKKRSLSLRTKERMVMGSKGVRFENAKSVKDLLMATYDALEIHRWLGKQRRILHCDMNNKSVLMYPELNSTTRTTTMVSNPPRFINEILDPKFTAHLPQCLLTDFSQSTPLDPSDAADVLAELSKQTGTPIYIARAVGTGFLVNTSRSLKYHPMPELSGKAKKKYILAYGPETYDDFSDGQGTVHGRIPPENPQGGRIPTVHRMDHDAESIFWLLLTTLLRAQPSSIPDDFQKLLQLNATWRMFDEHEIITSPPISESRQGIFGYSIDMFEDVLHPGLKCLAPMLFEMMVQVEPEYGFLDTPPREEHLHEALRRILLKYIVSMKADIPLDAGNLRPVDATRRAKKTSRIETVEVKEPHCDCERGFSKKRKHVHQGGRSSGSKQSRTSSDLGIDVSST